MLWHCKQTVIVFDKFLVYGYVSCAIEQVRHHEQNRADVAGKRLIQRSRWLWRKRSDRLRRKRQQSLKELMALNGILFKAYLLKEDVERFCACEERDEAQSFLTA